MYKNQRISNWLKIILILVVAIARQTDAVPAKKFHRSIAATNTTNTKDDLTTAWAQQIIRLSKAADIRAMLNTDYDPCDNFYQYACGNWHRSNPAQLLKNIMTDKFQMIAKAFDRRLEQMLNEASDGAGLPDKVRHFYAACQVVRRNDVKYKLALENVYKEFGELPLLAGDKWSDADEADFSWWQTIAKIQHKYGKQIILALDIMGDFKNNTINRIYIGPPDYSMSTNTKLLSVLQEISIVQDLEQYFGVEHQLAKQTAKEMIEFERKLVHSGSDVRLGLGLNELLTLTNITELKEQYSDLFDIEKYLALLLNGKEVEEGVAKTTDAIYIYDLYLSNMRPIIAATPKRTLANYILWQLLQEYLIDNTTEADLPKWCLSETKKYFGRYVDHLVYLRYKNEAAEEEVYQMWHEIRETFREELLGDKLDWIGNATRAYAVEKLDAMKLQINAYESENFELEYGNLTIERTNYVGNIQQILMQESRRSLAKLKQPATTLEAADVLSFTPAYNILENNIKIPVALLQPRFFWDINYPQALKYATLGYLIAHEMVHGFDDDGRNYDKHGNQQGFFDKKSTYEFDSRRKCFQAQYHNYKYGGRQLPESVSQSENIADNAGVKLAYGAYLRWLRSQREIAEVNLNLNRTETLPGLELDNRQLFFVNFAQVWCEDVQTLFRSSVASGDTHAPGMYRVIGSLSNFQEFSWVFKCKPDAPMDPEFKCSIY